MISDMIYAETVTSVSSDNTYYNLGTNTSFGIEIESRQMFASWFYSFINYSYNVSTNIKTIDHVEDEFAHVDVAPHKLNAGINLQLPFDLRFSTTLMYRSKMRKFTRINSETGQEEEVSQDPVGNYTIINSKLGYANPDLPFTVYFSVFNLLNTEYYSQDNEMSHYPPMPGINFLGGFSLHF
jgi:outer membrane receptor protein involved in Fe transport